MIFNLTIAELRAWLEQCEVQARALQGIEGAEGLQGTWEARCRFLRAAIQHEDAIRAEIEFHTIHAPMMRAFKGQEVR